MMVLDNSLVWSGAISRTTQHPSCALCVGDLLYRCNHASTKHRHITTTHTTIQLRCSPDNSYY